MPDTAAQIAQRQGAIRRTDDATPSIDDRIAALASALEGLMVRVDAIAAQREADAAKSEDLLKSGEISKAPSQPGEPAETASDDGDGPSMPDPPIRTDRATRADYIGPSDRILEMQQEWDRLAQMHGTRAPQPLMGEQDHSYDRRMARSFARYSPAYKNASQELATMQPGAAWNQTRQRIKEDAERAVYLPIGDARGMLREIKKDGGAGRTISEFVGPIDAVNGALAPFTAPLMRLNTNRLADYAAQAEIRLNNEHQQRLDNHRQAEQSRALIAALHGKKG